ncbi:hypothetical protein Tco_0915404 [Tanacetum coccineum]
MLIAPQAKRDPDYLAAAAADLSLISNLCGGEENRALFRGDMLASGIGSLRVDDNGSGSSGSGDTDGGGDGVLLRDENGKSDGDGEDDDG